MKNRDAYIVYLSIEGLFSLFFYTIITVNMVYQVVGVIGTLVSIRAAIVAAGTLLAPSLLFFLRALRQGKSMQRGGS